MTLACKPMSFEMFDPAHDMKWIRCAFCDRSVNIYDKPQTDPLTFGEATDSPESMTHYCLVHCRCGKTRIKVYGTMKMAHGIGCTIDESEAP